MASGRTALAVGATGMLRGALDWLQEQGLRTVVVARRSALPGVEAVTADWSQPDAWQRAVEAAVDPAQVDLALVWMHSSGHEARGWLMERLGQGTARVVLVVGSRSHPARLRSELTATWAGGATLHTVHLGRKEDARGSRWLTHAEISAGAIRALETGQDVVVGIVD